MHTFIRLSILGLALAFSTDLVQAQQPVRRPATKAVSSAKPVQTQVKKPVTPATATKTQAPATNPAPTPTETRQPAVVQATTHPQPVARPTTTYRSPRSSSTGHQVYLNAGLGLATYYGGGLPLGISVEVDAKNNFSVGGSIDFYRYKYGYYSGGYTFIYAGARGSYHLGEALNVQNNNFDPYVGATLGFRHAGYSDSYGSGYYDNGYNSGLFIGIHAGARFMFSPKVGAFAELGYGVSALKLGLTAKF